MLVHNILLISLALLVSVYIPAYYGIPVEQDLTLSAKEKKALEKFSEIMESSLTHDYMKKEIYLIKWLRRADLDLPKAESLLRNHLKWRKENRIDDILSEDSSYFKAEFPIDLDGVDLTGRPVIAANVAEWDVRRAVLAGQRSTTTRHVIRAIESACKMIRDKQAKGELVTQMQVIFDLKGYNLVQHGCLNCLPIYINFVLDFRRNYPEMADNVIFVNTPPVFATASEALNLRRYGHHIRFFGTNKKEWRKYLLSIISQDQLPKFLGGNRETDVK